MSNTSCTHTPNSYVEAHTSFGNKSCTLYAGYSDRPLVGIML